MSLSLLCVSAQAGFSIAVKRNGEASVPSVVTSAVRPEFHMRKADRTVSEMLIRWAAQEQWSLVWQASDDPAIGGDAHIIAGDYAEAVKVVITQSNLGGYSLGFDVDMKSRSVRVKNVAIKANSLTPNK